MSMWTEECEAMRRRFHASASVIHVCSLWNAAESRTRYPQRRLHVKKGGQQMHRDNASY